MSQLIALILAPVYTLFALIGLPTPPRGPALDMSKFVDEPSWADEFEGDVLNEGKWQPAFGLWGTCVWRGGYWNMDMAEVKDGCLTIRTAYMPQGIAGGPPGYYNCGIYTRGLFEQAYGYFEARCKLPRGAGHWAAFWLQCDGMENVDGTGIDGAEIDVFESPYYWMRSWVPFYRDIVTANVHIDGYGDALQSKNICRTNVPGNPYDEFHTYGLEWNEDEYIIYVDRIECGRSSFGGTSRVPEYLLLSVEVDAKKGEWAGVPGTGWAGNITWSRHIPSEFVVDYVRTYEYK